MPWVTGRQLNGRSNTLDLQIARACVVGRQNTTPGPCVPRGRALRVLASDTRRAPRPRHRRAADTHSSAPRYSCDLMRWSINRRARGQPHRRVARATGVQRRVTMGWRFAHVDEAEREPAGVTELNCELLIFQPPVAHVRATQPTSRSPAVCWLVPRHEGEGIAAWSRRGDPSYR